MEKINWLTMAGYVTFINNEITHRPERIKTDPQNKFPGLQKESYIRSNINIENGEISFNVRLKDMTNRCQLVFDCGDNDFLYIGINTGSYPFGIYKRTNGNYQLLSSVFNSQDNILNNISIKIERNYSQFTLYVNEVKAAEAVYPLSKSTMGLYFCGDQDITVTNFKYSPKKRRAFVVMQFTPNYDDLYKEVIKPVCEKYSYECVRADDFHTPTPILSDIINSITDASVIIAEITSMNPNVFYEIGYSHAIKKPTILLCDRNKVDNLPFDISSFRTLFYENTIPGKTKIEVNLSKYLEGF